MIIDANEIETGTSIRCDLCVIGAGAAGITLAREFDGTDLNVWLLESGSFEPEPETQAMYKGKSVGQPYFPLDRTRLRYLGGTTNHWTGLCRPLNELDFKKRDWLNYSGWPFDREHLIPWYRKAQVVCELDDFFYDVADWLPEDQKPSPFKAGNIRAEVYQNSPPTRFGKVYREQIRKSRNITACLHANVTRLQADNPPVQLQHLRIETLHGTKIRIQPRITVLACGSIENARLLLASNDIEAKGLGNSHGLIGRFFMDHLTRWNSGTLLTTTGRLSSFWYQPRHKAGRRLPIPTLLLANAVQRQKKIGNYSVIIRPPFRSAGLMSFTYLENSIKNDRKVDMFWYHMGKILGDVDDVTSMLYYRYSGSDDKPVELPLYSQWEQAPNPDSRITLSSDRDQLGMPRVKLDWRLSEIDKHTVVAGQLALARELGHLGIGRVRTELDEDLDPASLEGDQHQLGTTRMHVLPQQGVVDTNCRLHSLNNLFVAGGSVFPTAGSTNPTLTVVALALRLADHLQEKLA